MITNLYWLNLFDENLPLALEMANNPDKIHARPKNKFLKSFKDLKKNFSIDLLKFFIRDFRALNKISMCQFIVLMFAFKDF